MDRGSISEARGGPFERITERFDEYSKNGTSDTDAAVKVGVHPYFVSDLAHDSTHGIGVSLCQPQIGGFPRLAEDV